MDLRRAALTLALLPLGDALTAGDCNRNGSEDALDIAEGRSGDCNRNGVPDECDTLPAAFELAPRVVLDRAPTALAAADLDGDGDIDAAAAVAGAVVILAGDGRGGFHAAGTEPLTDDPVAVLAADTEGDGDTDLVLADALQDVRGRGALSLLENEGTGRFLPVRTVTVPPGPAALAAADLDEDGDLDLALACKDAGGVAILRGDGRGSYAEAPLLAAEGSPSLIAASDLDGDGKADVLAGDRTGTLSLFLQGPAGPAERSAIRLDVAFEALSLGDFDGDGDDDIAVSGQAGNGSGRLVVLGNDGKGAFAAGLPRSIPNPRAIAAADLDGDGRAEILIVDETASSLTVRPGSQTAADAPAHGYATGPSPRKAEAADLDRDGDLDVLVAEEAGLSSLLNDGSGRLKAPLSIHVGPGAGWVTSVEALPNGREAPLDFDRDGRRDLAVTHYTDDGRCTVVFGGAGGFPEEIMSFATGPRSSSRDVAAADLDGDGLPDFAVAHGQSVDGGLSVHLNGGRRNLVKARVLASGASIYSVSAGDFDRDGDVDLASVAGHLSIWENRGDATFPRRLQIDVGGAFEVVAADLDGDGDLDLAAAAGSDSKISIVENLGGGLYAEARAIESDASYQLFAADLDGDGRMDLAADGREGLLLFWNRGDATFEMDSHPSAGYEVQSIAPADLDGDGDVDFVLAGFEDAPIEIILNRGRRKLRSLPPLQTTGRVLSIGAVDLDADGRAEVLASRPIDGTVLLFRTISPASSPDRNGNDIPDECEGTLFVRGDTDADGRMGIADAVFLLLHLFRGGSAPPCDASADVDGDGRLLLGDPVGILDYLFRAGPEPAPPFPDCDALAPGEGLRCQEYPPCAV